MAAGHEANANAYGEADQRRKGDGDDIHLHPPIRPWAVGRDVVLTDPPQG
jgi:hypothetical protein